MRTFPMPGISENDHLKLAAIISQTSWRSDRELLGMFMVWIHAYCGLAWQRTFYSAGELHGNPFTAIDTVELYIENQKISRIGVIFDDNHKFYSFAELNPALIGRLLWSAQNTSVSGFDPLDAGIILNKTGSLELHETSVLFCKLQKEYVFSKKYTSRKRRLWNKFNKDPVLFFRDSDKLSGRTIYKVIRLFRLEQNL